MDCGVRFNRGNLKDCHIEKKGETMKKAISMFLGIGIIVCFFVATGFAQQYHIVYSGADFQAYSSFYGYVGSGGGVYAAVAQNQLSCGVHFPDSANGMQVQRVSISVVDNDASYFDVYLYKKDRWTGNITAVAVLTTSGLSQSISEQFVNIPKSQMQGYRIDNTRYSWFLFVLFWAAGSGNFRLDQVTIRYY
jgi:hypothetical protein